MAPAINKEIAWDHQIYLCAGFHGRVVPSYGRQCAKQGTQRSVIAEKFCRRRLGTWIEKDQADRAGFNRVRNQKEI